MNGLQLNQDNNVRAASLLSRASSLIRWSQKEAKSGHSSHNNYVHMITHHHDSLLYMYAKKGKENAAGLVM